MGEKTAISWCDHSFNPWIGCQRVSEGCVNCYAEAWANRYRRGHTWGPDSLREVTRSWTKLRTWNRKAGREGVRRRVFVGSLCDVFEDAPTPNLHRPRLWRWVRDCRNLDFLFLTKRPENIWRMLPDDWCAFPWKWGHVWLGTSIEHMRVAQRRVHLLAQPAAVRFISYEPALGPLHEIDLTGIDWVIYGAETGANRRLDNPDWARSMRDRCRREGVAFFYKQGSALRPGQHAELNGEVIQEFPR